MDNQSYYSSIEPDSSETLLEGFRIRVTRDSDGALTIKMAPRYVEAIFAALISVPFLLIVIADWFIWEEDSLLKKIQNEGVFFGYILYIAIISIPLFISIFGAAWFIHCLFPREFVVSRDKLTFSGVPGTGFCVSLNDIEAVHIWTACRRVYWDCHVSLFVSIRGKNRRVCVNYDSVCSPRQIRKHRRSEQEEWLIEQHRPLASLISSVVGKPVEIHRKIGFREWLHKPF
jgi:hypothetical protein